MGKVHSHFFINLRLLTLSCLWGEYILMLQVSNFTSMYSPNQMKPQIKFIRNLDVNGCCSYPTVSIWQYFQNPTLKRMNCTVCKLYINNNGEKHLAGNLKNCIIFTRAMNQSCHRGDFSSPLNFHGQTRNMRLDNCLKVHCTTLQAFSFKQGWGTRWPSLVDEASLWRWLD